MKLYTNPASPNCRKVHALAAHLGVELERVPVNLRAGEHKQPDYLAVNPNGKVPALVDGALKLWESNAILGYVAGHGVADTATWPKNDTRYDILRWMFWEANYLTKAMGALIGEKVFKPLRGGTPDPAVIEAQQAEFRRLAEILDGELASRTFLTGPAITIADFAVGVWFGYRQICDLPVAGLANVERWLGDCAKAKGWSELTPPKL